MVSFNEAREEIETALNNAKTAMEKAIREAKLKEEVIDVTLPSKKTWLGIVIRIQLRWKKLKEFYRHGL